MASNSFGKIFRITSWGESHGKAIGVVIDGCPAGLPLAEEEINGYLSLRAPGHNAYTTPRKEPDIAEVYSGLFNGVTTGAPISIIIHNRDVDSGKYEPIKETLRPGHANYTYLEKYGLFDYRGGGRSSARETACRVAAGAVAKKLLSYVGIELASYIVQIADILANVTHEDLDTLRAATYSSPCYCPDGEASTLITRAIDTAREERDSLGGVVEFIATGIPPGLGDPIYDKLEARLADAMMSLPATKGFSIGSGFHAPAMKGSAHNDLFVKEGKTIRTKTNHAGGTLGGISTGMPIVGRVAFKPTSSIMKSQESLSLQGEPVALVMPEGSRHDPCVAIRAVPIVEAMAALVLIDAYLMNRCARL